MHLNGKIIAYICFNKNENKMKTHIKESTLKGLIDNLKLQTGNDLDAVGFSSRFGPFEMSFYAEIEDGLYVTCR